MCVDLSGRHAPALEVLGELQEGVGEPHVGVHERLRVALLEEPRPRGLQRIRGREVVVRGIEPVRGARWIASRRTPISVRGLTDRRARPAGTPVVS
jgi:hypothetical protein